MNESFVEYEWSLDDANGLTVAAGSAKTFDEASAELSHYIFMYREESESLRFEISGVSRTVISSGTIAKDASKYQTTDMENFWSLLKRGIVGIYHQVTSKHLHRYCGEFDYRYNTRDEKDCNRFTSTFKNIEGRLTYKELIKAA